MNKNLKFFLRLSVTLALVFALYLQLKKTGAFSNLAERIHELAVLPLVIAAAVFLVSLFASSLQWHMLLKIQNIKIPFKITWDFYMIGQFFSSLLPMSWGGDFVRIYDMGAYSENWEKSTASIIVDRVIGLFALFLIGALHALVFIFLVKYKGMGEWMTYSIIATGLGLLAVAFFIFFDLKKFTGLVRSKNKIIQKITHFTDKFILALSCYQKDHRLIPVLGVALVTQYLRVFMNIFVAFAFGYSFAQIPYIMYYVAIPVVGVASVLPVSVGGFGMREMTGFLLISAMLKIFNPLVDLNQYTTVPLVFTTGTLVMLAVSLIGGYYFFVHQNLKRARERAKA